MIITNHVLSSRYTRLIIRFIYETYVPNQNKASFVYDIVRVFPFVHGVVRTFVVSETICFYMTFYVIHLQLINNNMFTPF
jgi:hypothetical protein